MRQGQEGELFELEGLCRVEGWQVGSVLVCGVGAIAEDTEELQMREMLRGGGELLDVG